MPGRSRRDLCRGWTCETSFCQRGQKVARRECLDLPCRRRCALESTRFEIRRDHSTALDLICQWWDEPVELAASDISPAGAFVPTPLLLEVGEPVVACFCLPGFREEFQIFGNVVWVALPRRATDRGQAGMGIEFVKTSPLERLSIRQALRDVPLALPTRVRKGQATFRA